MLVDVGEEPGKCVLRKKAENGTIPKILEKKGAAPVKLCSVVPCSFSLLAFRSYVFENSLHKHYERYGRVKKAYFVIDYTI